MSKDASREKLQELLNTLYSNIVHHAREDVMQTAEKSYYSTRDYALGDTISCGPEAAIENCEQIRGYFPKTVPRSVFENIEEIIDEIRRLEKKGKPHFFVSPWTLLMIVGIAVFIYRIYRIVTSR